MIKKKQRKALAEIAGYKSIDVDDALFPTGSAVSFSGAFLKPLPEFESSLEDLRKVEMHVGLHSTDAEYRKLRIKWVGNLRKIIGRRMPKNKVGAPIFSDIDLLMMPVEERAEALLLTFNKWEESE